MTPKDTKTTLKDNFKKFTDVPHTPQTTNYSNNNNASSSNKQKNITKVHTTHGTGQ